MKKRGAECNKNHAVKASALKVAWTLFRERLILCRGLSPGQRVKSTKAQKAFLPSNQTHPVCIDHLFEFPPSVFSSGRRTPFISLIY